MAKGAETGMIQTFVWGKTMQDLKCGPRYGLGQRGRWMAIVLNVLEVDGKFQLENEKQSLQKRLILPVVFPRFPAVS